MAYSFDTFTQNAKDTLEWLTKEFSGIRTGRATPAILDGVTVESYGTRMSLREVGSVGIEDARTLRVSLWDSSQIKAVEKALIEADLGLSVVSDDKGIRVIFPELSADRRDQLTKLAKSKLEDARVAIRKARDEANKELDTAKKASEIGEDDAFRAKADLQKKVDDVNASLEALFAKKEEELKA